MPASTVKALNYPIKAHYNFGVQIQQIAYFIGEKIILDSLNNSSKVPASHGKQKQDLSFGHVLPM